MNKKTRIEVEFDESCLDINRGKLIAVEGIDGCGKNTNVDLLTEVLERQGYNVIVYHYPQYETTIGKVIASYLKGDYGDVKQVPKELICTAYAADRAKNSEDIALYLENGYIVICDRYTYSNIFTAAKLPKDEWDTFVEWIEDLEFNCLGVIKPDYNFYLHVDPNISIERIAERGKRDYQQDKEDIHESNEKLLFNASEAYLYFANKRDNWVIIDEMKDGKQIPIEEVFAKFFAKVIEILK